MSKLSISIITRNRAKHIKEDLKCIAEDTKTRGIDIYIFDGTTNESTKKVVYSYIDKGYSNIHYLHYIDNWENGNIPDRFIDAFFLPNTEYCWVCGDRCIIMPLNYDIIIDSINKNYDIITLYDKCFKGTKTFSSPVDFVDYCIVPITHWGSTIIKKFLISQIDIRQEIVKNQSFWMVNSIVNAINIETFSGLAIHICNSQFLLKSKYPTRSATENTMWDTWVYNWYRLIYDIPIKYKRISNGLYSRLDKEMGFFGFKELLRQRSTGQLDIKEVIKYREYAKHVILLPIEIVSLIAVIPKNIAKMIYMNLK